MWTKQRCIFEMFMAIKHHLESHQQDTAKKEASTVHHASSEAPARRCVVVAGQEVEDVQHICGMNSYAKDGRNTKELQSSFFGGW